MRIVAQVSDIANRPLVFRVSSAKVFCWGIVSLLGLSYPIHTGHFYVFKKCVVQVRVVFRVLQKVSCSLLLLSC